MSLPNDGVRNGLSDLDGCHSSQTGISKQKGGEETARGRGRRRRAIVCPQVSYYCEEGSEFGNRQDDGRARGEMGRDFKKNGGRRKIKEWEHD